MFDFFQTEKFFIQFSFFIKQAKKKKRKKGLLFDGLRIIKQQCFIFFNK